MGVLIVRIDKDAVSFVHLDVRLYRRELNKPKSAPALFFPFPAFGADGFELAPRGGKSANDGTG